MLNIFSGRGLLVAFVIGLVCGLIAPHLTSCVGGGAMTKICFVCGDPGYITAYYKGKPVQVCQQCDKALLEGVSIWRRMMLGHGIALLLTTILLTLVLGRFLNPYIGILVFVFVFVLYFWYRRHSRLLERQIDVDIKLLGGVVESTIREE